jgi:hypothetical protein
MPTPTRMFFTLLCSLLPAAATFAGTITGTVRGPDSTSAGISGATVVLTLSSGQGARAPVDTTQTDAQGKYTFPDLAAKSSYGVTASATGFQTVSVNRLALDSVETKTVNVTLPLPMPPAKISGTVRGPDSTSPVIPNAKVILSKSGGGQGSRAPLDSAVTDTQGHFEFANLPAADNYGIDIPAPSASFRDYSDHNVDLRGVDIILKVVLDPPPAPGTLTGTVRGPDSTSPVIPNAKVVLTLPGSTDSLRIPFDSAMTDTAGKFTFANIPPNEDYGVIITSPVAGFRVYSREGLTVDGDTTTLRVRLRAIVGVIAHARLARGFHATWSSTGLSLKFPSAPQARTLGIYDLGGCARYQAKVAPHASEALLPINGLHKRGLKLLLSGPDGQEAFSLPNL